MHNVCRYTTTMLKMICELLDIERSGKKEDVIERILNFLMKPTESGKKPPTKKREYWSILTFSGRHLSCGSL